MNFSEQAPSQQWAALKLRGTRLAEVWFKPEGEPLVLIFRILQQSFQVPGLAQRLTPENLLKAVGIAPEDVESWEYGDVSHTGIDDADPELRNPIPPLPPDVPHLDIYVQLKPPPEAVAPERDAATAKWQELEARWKTILGLEATMDTVRIGMEGLQMELDGQLKRSLTADEKVHAISSDLVQWNKAKNRVHYVVPKAKEFIHRATWALGLPERKQLDEFFKTHTGPDVPLAEMDRVLEQLDNLLKDRQVLCAQGVAVQQECRGIAANIQAALRTLQNNATARAAQKRRAAKAKGKFI